MVVELLSSYRNDIHFEAKYDSEQNTLNAKFCVNYRCINSQRKGLQSVSYVAFFSLNIYVGWVAQITVFFVI